MTRREALQSTLLTLVLVVVLILTAGITAYVVSARYFGDNGPDGQTLGEMYNLGEYTTDLAGAGLIQVDITLELKPGMNRAKLDKARTPIDDRVLSVLRSKTRDEVRGDRGMEGLKSDILNEMQAAFGEGISGIYFTKYIVQ